MTHTHDIGHQNFCAVTRVPLLAPQRYSMEPIKHFVWQCPCCSGDTGRVSRLSEAALDLAVMMHIRKHEDVASLRAVDRARIQCDSLACGIDQAKQCDQTTGSSLLRLTEYDFKFLYSMKISIE